MRKKSIAYRHGEVGKVKVVKDFLPPPERLVPRHTNVKLSRPPKEVIDSGQTQTRFRLWRSN